MDWTGGKASIYTTLGASNHSETDRQVHDYYATDPVAIDALARRGFFDGVPEVWEPACGGGHLSRKMEGLGIRVISTDLYDNGYGEPDHDFLRAEKLLAPVIVTNPPYKYAKEFVVKAMELGATKVAMFLKLTFLEGQARQKLFQKYPPKEVSVFVERIQCAYNGDEREFAKPSAACYAWFIWEKGFAGDPKVTWSSRRGVEKRMTPFCYNGK